MVKTTIPTPSLKRLSPATALCSESGTFSSFRTPSTETGSVGAMRAPNTKYQIGAIDRPSSRPTPHVASPTRTVETITPTVESSSTGSQALRSLSRSTCSAPANSRKLSIPCNSVSVKLSCWRRRATVSSSVMPGMTAFAIINPIAPSAPITVSPMTCGSFRKWWLNQPSRADATTRIAAMSKAESDAVAVSCMLSRLAGDGGDDQSLYPPSFAAVCATRLPR